MDIGTSVSNMRCGMVADDQFTKIANAIPIDSKQPEEAVRGFKELDRTIT